jgi:hypothetical protein
VKGRVVETVFVFDRHAATDLSVAYDILVPEPAALYGAKTRCPPATCRFASKQAAE